MIPALRSFVKGAPRHGSAPLLGRTSPWERVPCPHRVLIALSSNLCDVMISSLLMLTPGLTEPSEERSSFLTDAPRSGTQVFRASHLRPKQRMSLFGIGS